MSGQSLRAFADANIFKPLGMTHTHFHDDPAMIVPNRASGYERDEGGLHLALHGDLGRIVSNTGLFTTAGDLLLWEQNFTQARVGDPALLAGMQKPTVLTGGETSAYGLGLQIGGIAACERSDLEEAIRDMVPTFVRYRHFDR